MRIMAIDYGDAHTGVAVSDPTGFLTGDVTTIHSRKAEVVLEELTRLVQTYQVDELVMGFPRNMDGTEGPRAQLYRDFARQVEEATGLKPVLWDERRTTIDAHRILLDAGSGLLLLPARGGGRHPAAHREVDRRPGPKGPPGDPAHEADGRLQAGVRGGHQADFLHHSGLSAPRRRRTRYM